MQIDLKEVVSIEPSKVSTMPTMLLSLLTKEELLGMLVYILILPAIHTNPDPK